MMRQIARRALLALGIVAGIGLVGHDMSSAQAQPYPGGGGYYRYGPTRPGWSPPPPPAVRYEAVPPPRGRGWVWQQGVWDWGPGGYAWMPGRYVRYGGHGGWGPGRWERRGPRWVWIRPGWR
ncbi:hypothetical protein HLH34_06585 [Gluconacetobacter azotocaptans]|uniref:YXWGXW repeat-containing protein n=1 Tax=Gluconacetobacter azotocaptans TaxID=142834 RepID=A0A7W4PEJ3_9PROT|nr:YXWGXW repeat-containing protein [Gluconacetobacter azotocaptans]MBB2189629.1 hypothetical protein [Gluconacetobacter azotocaptans]MBM9403086.1 hypothetical protein [Gluconacetobacter azotocaptans]GBQ36330.1 hypothetical protein AA13594_3271 [Gluconacetobacter azotocaptans DSM 13594]